MDAKTPNGDAIRELRVAKGMTQEKLAHLSKVDVKTIYRAERGDLAVRLETLLDLAAALEVPLERILKAESTSDGVGPSAPESYRSLVLRRVASASEYAELAAQCQHYAFRVQLDPDEATAGRMRELLEITRRIVLGAERARDRFDDEAGEFSAPGRIARLKVLLDELRQGRVSVFANRFVESGAARADAARIVLQLVFVEADVQRVAIDAGRPSEPGPQGKVLEGVRRLDSAVHASSVMGALKLALETIGEDVSYAFLMGASGAAFRLQIAHPVWCPSAPYAGVGFDCIPHAARAIGRTIEWHRPQDERRTAAIIASIDRGVPALYGAEECGLVVGYRESGRQLALRTYFDRGPAYSLLDRPTWAGVGILGERQPLPARSELLRGALARALSLAEETGTPPTHRPGSVYLCGLAAWREWIAGLRDEIRHAGYATRESEVVALRANGWCYRSLIDARRSAAGYLREESSPAVPELAAALERAAAAYDALVERLSSALPAVPVFGNDATTPWTADGRRAQADALEAGAELERSALAELRSSLALLDAA